MKFRFSPKYISTLFLTLLHVYVIFRVWNLRRQTAELSDVVKNSSNTNESNLKVYKHLLSFKDQSPNYQEIISEIKTDDKQQLLILDWYGIQDKGGKKNKTFITTLDEQCGDCIYTNDIDLEKFADAIIIDTTEFMAGAF